ncbi:AGL294Wp [Eremothecium gossypii ATCC 10895]|uniref:AGL294Wp n=1 Tax=Eremothecium gossypii (strain ATCC 10895 / CBS 109.51 / FGSC 9923 / NRRL Y-1056) TaxID=284811 RepID=Q751K0_EREGS|nr:AGL294Wp [Eremothecium gossypii ATCC 10895]AAS54197.1 AGL294Wp [Eremothecium gossypii ATCC 10895]AEY98523.1 FAGL294Wp [Eremothecium gossypii FDAG1]
MDRQHSSIQQQPRMSAVLQETISQLKHLIITHIQQLNYDSAEFFSELLYADCSCTNTGNNTGTIDESRERFDSLYYYALTLYLQGDYHSSVHVVKDALSSHLGCAYVYARCCLKLGTRYQDAIQALMALRDCWQNGVTNSTDLFMYPDKATVLSVMGQLSLKSHREKEAVSFLSQSLSTNSYQLEPLSILFEMRADLQTVKLFKPVKKSWKAKHLRTANIISKPQTPFKIPSRLSTSAVGAAPNPLLSTSSAIVSTSPSMMRRSKFLNSNSNASNATSNINNNNNVNNNGQQSTPPSKLLNIEHNKTTPDDKLSPSQMQLLSHNPLPHKPLDQLMYWMMKAYKSYYRYDSYRAIRLLNEQLPSHILQNMPWCLALLSRLHFEIQNHDMSLSYFNKLRRLQPTRLKDMDVYSTLLWHLHDKIRLADLCHELMAQDDKNCITWCCLGNLFSLNRDHDEAIKALKKATSLNPQFAYAYTLQGHEYSNNDAFDNAKMCYRKALAINPNHYNAHYGLGMSCIKLGQYDEALLHFEKARSINPVNVILNCCCGVALERLGRREKALDFYQLACELQPNSSLALFKKSQLLFNLGQYSNALQNFEKLEQLTPNEAPVHFLLGQLYQIVGRKKDAITQFTIAMNLDPNGIQLVKEALEKCHEQG